MMLAQRQVGRTEHGSDEILERYETEDGTESIILNASPEWLAQLRNYEAMFSYWSTK